MEELLSISFFFLAYAYCCEQYIISVANSPITAIFFTFDRPQYYPWPFICLSVFKVRLQEEESIVVNDLTSWRFLSLLIVIFL